MRPGMGVMIRMLGGDNGSEIFQKAINKRIKSVAIDPEANNGDGGLIFAMEDESLSFMMSDKGRSCCESRWMHTDDDLTQFAGAVLLDAEISPGAVDEEDYETKESQFLKVITSEGSFTVVTYNHHNGYYGGFWIEVTKL